MSPKIKALLNDNTDVSSPQLLAAIIVASAIESAAERIAGARRADAELADALELFVTNLGPLADAECDAGLPPSWIFQAGAKIAQARGILAA